MKKKFNAWNKVNNTMHKDITNPDNWSFSFLNQDIYIWLQWTGLTDKNNIDIYEGDIIKYYIQSSFADEILSIEVEVTWHKYGWHPYCDKAYLLDNAISVEVIGNQYETPQLLEEKIKQ